MSMKVVLVLINLKIIFCVFANADVENCEKIDYNKFVYRTSTTLYDDVRGYGKIDHEGCQPYKMWAMVRHGIRNNYKKSSQRAKVYGAEFKHYIIKMNKIGQGLLCREDIEAISAWTFDDLVTYETHFLTTSGEREMYEIGKRFTSLYPEIFKTNNISGNIKLGYSKHQRAIASCRAFARGLYGNDSYVDKLSKPFLSDIPEADCYMNVMKNYEEYYDKFPPADKFYKDSGLYEKIANSMAMRTGLPVKVFTNETIRTFYESCTYESAKNEKISPWCRIFSLEDLRWMGYREEFLHYSFASYSSKYIKNLGCKQMKDLVSTFEKIDSSNQRSNSFIAYFGHDFIIEELVTRLGCFKDPEPITNNYTYFSSHKKWNLSKIAPFGANLVAVLYRCNYIKDDYKLQFYLNENPIGCCMTNSTKSCSWNAFRDSMAGFVSNCKNFFCEDEFKKTSSGHTVYSNLLFLIYFIVVSCVCNWF